MFLVSSARGVLAVRFKRAAATDRDLAKWQVAFAMGAGLAGAGWGGAGVFLYPAAPLANQVFLVFVLGGMMLGSSSLLAPRPEAFLLFLLPPGLRPPSA